MGTDKVKSSLDYFSKDNDWDNDSFLQVYEEFLNLIYWVKGFEPANILEIGTRGTSFFLLSKFSKDFIWQCGMKIGNFLLEIPKLWR